MTTPRIGLFTFYTGNYGAALQAFATQYYIRGTLRKECVVVRTRPGVPGETLFARLILRGEIFRNPIGKLRRRLRRSAPIPESFRRGLPPEPRRSKGSNGTV